MRITKICALLAVASSGMLAPTGPVSALDDVICVEDATDQKTVKGPDGYVTTVHSYCVRWLWVPDKAGDTPSYPLPNDGKGIDPGNDEPVSCEEYAKWLDSMHGERRGLIDLLPDAEYDAQYWAARAATEEAVAVDLADRWVRSKLAYADVERIYLEQNGLDATIEWENSHGATLTRPTIEGASDIDTSLPGGSALMRAWNGRTAAGSATVAARNAANASDAQRATAARTLDEFRQRIEDLTRAIDELRAAEKSCQ
jgi:hypothetical protein